MFEVKAKMRIRDGEKMRAPGDKFMVTQERANLLVRSNAVEIIREISDNDAKTVSAGKRSKVV
jgi:hypothetical protein